jgi:polyisoprenoid-binding protein YceI
MKKQIYILFLSLFLTGIASSQVFKTNTAEISFLSKTDFETFQATSNQASAAFSVKEGKVQFRVPVNSFIFEKKLMQTHFQENYMESGKFPNGSFKGEIIYPEKFVLSSKEQNVKVKGIFNIHGEEKEAEVSGTLAQTKEGVVLKADLFILLTDYKIIVPSNSINKISQKIEIKVNALLAATPK